VDLRHLDTAALRQSLRQGQCSSRELTTACLTAIQRLDPDINAFITIDPDDALAQADAADQRRARGEDHPLLGIPMAVKDLFCTRNLRTTCGARILEKFIPPYESTATARLRQAGAILLGKSNMDAFAMGSTNEHSDFGPCRNPWDLQRSPGGSSGGSAAAIAARMAWGAIASDTGGSVRVPAAYCGCVGFKPTYGRVSRYGMIAFASSLDQAGALARDVTTAAAIIEAVAGADPADATCAQRPAPSLSAIPPAALAAAKVGVIQELFAAPMEPAAAEAYQDTLQRLAKAGLELHNIHLPELQTALPAYHVIAMAEAASNLARYDGLRFGQARAAADLHHIRRQSRAAGFNREVKRRIITGTYILSAGQQAGLHPKAMAARAAITAALHRALRTTPLLLSPTTPRSAPPLLLQAPEDPILTYHQDLMTVGPSLAGLPAISLPCARIHQRPLGLQIIAAPFAEATLIAFARAIEALLDPLPLPCGVTP